MMFGPRIASSPAVPRGTVGEIEITGPNVFPGYHNLPGATAAAFSPDGWFRSGDMGYLDPDGYLYIADRLKDMIISGGENIYPAEIENLISDIDGVTGVAVIGVPDDQWGEVPWAVVTVREGVTVDSDLIRGHLDGRIARYKLPKNVIVIDEWAFETPKTKDAIATLTALGVEGKALVVLGSEDVNAARSFRNIPTVQIIEARELNAYDVLVNDVVIFTKANLPGSGAQA